MHVSNSFTHLKTWGPLECPLVWNLHEITSLNMIITFILPITITIKHHQHHHWEKNLTKKVVFALGRISPALTLEERRQTLEIPILLQTNNLSKRNLPIVGMISKKHKDVSHFDVFQPKKKNRSAISISVLALKSRFSHYLLLKKKIANNLCLAYKRRILKNSWTHCKYFVGVIWFYLAVVIVC